MTKSRIGIIAIQWSTMVVITSIPQPLSARGRIANGIIVLALALSFVPHGIVFVRDVVRRYREWSDLVKNHPDQERPRDHEMMRMLEIMLGFSVACILTIGFLGTLQPAGKIALCLF